MSEISTTILEPTIRRALGSDDDPLGDVVPRLRSAYPGRRFILWEGDPQTFELSQILGDAEKILGHQRAAWLRSRHRQRLRPLQHHDQLALAGSGSLRSEAQPRPTAGPAPWLFPYSSERMRGMPAASAPAQVVASGVNATRARV